jgi:hypothetical protein
MMTYLRYWLPVGFLLLAVAIFWFLPSFSSKWPLVVIGFMLLPLAWSFHFLVKQKFSWREPSMYLWIAVALALISSIFASNPYAALHGWFVFLVSVVVYLLVRSLTAEHRTPFMVGVIIVGLIVVIWSYLATKTSLFLPWLPSVGKDPLLLAASTLLPLACALGLLFRDRKWAMRIGLVVLVIILLSPWTLPTTWHAWQDSWVTLTKQTQLIQQVFSSHPVVGVGLGNYTEYFPRFVKDASIFAQHAPSSIIEGLVSFGLLPLLAFLAFLFFSIRQMMLQKSVAAWVSFAGLVLFGAIVFISFGDHPMFALSWPILFGLMSKPLVTQEQPSKETRQLLRRSLIAGGWVLAVVSLAMGLGINRFGRAERAAQSGDTKNAATLYAAALRFDPDPEQRRAYAESLWLNGHQTKDLNEAEHQAKLAYQFNREDAFAYQVAARIAFAQGNNTEAERLYREVINRDPFFSLDAFISFADVYKKQKKTSEERQILQQAMANYTPEVLSKGFVFPNTPQQLEAIKKRLEELKK